MKELEDWVKETWRSGLRVSVCARAAEDLTSQVSINNILNVVVVQLDYLVRAHPLD